jgi:heme/copper-type cytochrome/quinol oxidase subunit 2
VGVGERVRLNITSTDGDHGFRVQPFGVDAQIPADGRAVSVDLTPTEAGCSTSSARITAGAGTRSCEPSSL